MAFSPAPPYAHGSVPKTGILYCNLGTPDEPTAPALRRYLAEFLSDPRVVEIPKPIWWLILHGIILRVRPAKSAAKYASIWTPEGSPLRVWTEKQAAGLQAALAEQGHPVSVKVAMRYGKPGVASVMDAFAAEGCTRVLVLPAYPQYSGTTTASVADAVYAWAAKARWLPELRFVNQYHDHAGYIQALAAKVRAHWAAHGALNLAGGDKLVMSFHGVPKRTLMLGDPYHCQAHKTGRLLAEALGLQKGDYRVTFQSRFGKAEWLQPYTEPTVMELAQAGTKRIDVVCPGFTSDCLETLEEIAMEVREAFTTSGGQAFHYIPCLNDDAGFVAALAGVAQQHMAGWPTQAGAGDSAEALAAQRSAALALGAKD